MIYLLARWQIFKTIFSFHKQKTCPSKLHTKFHSITQKICNIKFSAVDSNTFSMQSASHQSN